MTGENFLEKILNLFNILFFRVVGIKFHASSLRNFMNNIFEFLEKILFKFEIFSNYYLKMYDEIITNEIELADVNSADLILVIGCGAVPASAVKIAMKTEANIVAIDNDIKSVKYALSFVKNLCLEKRIKIQFADGISFSKELFDVIFILYGVKDVKKILSKQIRNFKDGVRIIYRLPEDLREKIANNEIIISDSILIKDCVRSKTFSSVDSYLLLKKI